MKAHYSRDQTGFRYVPTRFYQFRLKYKQWLVFMLMPHKGPCVSVLSVFFHKDLFCYQYQDPTMLFSKESHVPIRTVFIDALWGTFLQLESSPSFSR